MQKEDNNNIYKLFFPIIIMIISDKKAEMPSWNAMKLVFVVFLILLGTILFSGVFRALLIGSAFAVGALFVVMSSTNEKLKASFAIILLIGATFFIFSGGVLNTYLAQNTDTHYFYDGELGMLKFSSSDDFLTKQTIFSKTNVVLGETIYLKSSVTYSDAILSAYTFEARAWIMKNGDAVKDYDLPNYGKAYSISWKPDKIGTYSVEDDVLMCKKSTPSDCTFTTYKGNSVTVTNPVAQCTKTPYYSDWRTVKYVTGGKIQDRDYFMVVSDCQYKQSGTDSRIVCDDGYKVFGTSSSISSYNGIQFCEAIYVAPVEPTPECNTDLTSACSDGSLIVDKRCINGFFQDTSEVCKECTSDVTKSCSDGSAIITKKCINGFYSTTNNVCPTLAIPNPETDPIQNIANEDTEDKTDEPSVVSKITDSLNKLEQKATYSGLTIVISLLISGIIVVMIILIIVKLRKKRR